MASRDRYIPSRNGAPARGQSAPPAQPAANPAAASPTAPSPSVPSDLLSRLTPREREVLALFIETCHDKKVAARLGISVQTVRNQIASIQHKLGVESREVLIKIASQTRASDTLSWLK